MVKLTRIACRYLTRANKGLCIQGTVLPPTLATHPDVLKSLQREFDEAFANSTRDKVALSGDVRYLPYLRLV
jgi:hypothetical protein